MAKYLNLDGLQTLWAKLKDTFALKKHSHTVEDIPVDSALSSTSENPVQNKVVNTALAGKSATSHAHGLSNNSFYGTCTNSTTDDGWKMLDSNIDGKTSNYAALRAIRFNANAPAWAVGNYGAGIFFGGADTKGLISLTYPSNAINVKFAGGSGSKPAWWFGLSGSSGKNYTLENMRERYSLAYHRNSTDNKQWTKIAWHQESNYPTGDSWNTSTAVINFYQNSYGGTHLANLGRLMLQSYWGHSKVAEGGTPYSFKTSGTKNAYWQHYVPSVCYVGDYTTYNSGRLNVKIVCSDDTIEWWVANCIWDTSLQFDVLYKYNINLSGNGTGSVIMTNDEFNEYCEDKLVRDVTIGDGTTASSAATTTKALALCRNNTTRQLSINLAHESGGTGNALTRVDQVTSAISAANGRPDADGFVMTFNWDTTAPYDTQIFIPNGSNANANAGIPKIRFRDNKSAWGAWGELNIGGNAATASKAATINIGAKDGNWRDILASFDGATSVYRTYLRSYADSNNGTILEIGREKNDNTKGSQIRLIRYDASGNQLIGIIRNSTITENRNWYFPDASGTLALTSDLSSYATKAELNAKQDDISDLIPTAASASNPLCDKAYADAIGERLEARYLGCNANGDPFATHAALTSATKFYYQGAETTPDTNDITTVVADEDHKNTSNVAGTTRYRYGGVDANGKPVWAFEYVINNTGLSQAQLLAVNSGITATKVGNYDSHLADTTKHITAAERTAWNGKQNALTQGTNITISGNTISATDTTYANVTPEVIIEILNAMQVSD